MRIVERSEAVALDLQQGLAFGDLLRRQVSAEGVAAARHRHRSRLGVHGLHFGILGRGRQREDGFRAHVLHRHGVIGQLVGVRDEGFGRASLWRNTSLISPSRSLNPGVRAVMKSASATEAS